MAAKYKAHSRRLQATATRRGEQWTTRCDSTAKPTRSMAPTVSTSTATASWSASPRRPRRVWALSSSSSSAASSSSAGCSSTNAIPYAEETVKHLGEGKPFDPVPWILLNLIFSGVAFYTGALVIIAQKAQSKTDKANEEAAAKHRDELAQFQSNLLTENTDLTEQIHTLSQTMSTLTQEVHEATCKGDT